ncbi:MAG TPA: SMC family ATPase [Geobacteraceae bacterium]
MQILSMHLKNIKSHRDRSLSFAPGINVLSGPNGVGKSTVFEAIGYALFGVDARDFVSNVDRFLTIGAKKGEVSVTFRTDAGETWRVNRTVGTPAKWLLSRETGGAFEVEEHARIEETEARIAGLLGLANGRPLAEQFKLVIGPFQNDFLGPFVIRQATKRQEAFDEILGIDAWRKTFKGTTSLIAAVQERIKVLAAEVEAKEAQIAVLPEREAELAGIVAAGEALQTELKGREDGLQRAVELLQQLDRQKESLDTAENAVRQTGMSIESGKEYVASQKVLVEHAEAATRIVAQSLAGKEAFERAEGQLRMLREREKARRAIEQEVAALDREAERLAQAHGHEQREVGKAEEQLAADERKLNEARQALQPDAQLVATAARLEELRNDVERIKAERALLDGRRSGLKEGRDRLAEGVCPYFQEPCLNVAGSAPDDVFSARVNDLDGAMRQLDERIGNLSREVKAAETARQEVQALTVRGQELDKQVLALADLRRQNRERGEALEKLRALQAEAAARAAARRRDVQAFAALDEEITRAEMERARFQEARDAFHANQKDAADLDNRRQTMTKYTTRLEELLRDLASQQAEILRLREVYQPGQHQEVRQQKDTLVAETATLRQRIEGLTKDRVRIEGEILKLRQVKEAIEQKVAEKTAFEEKEKLVKFLRNQVFKNVSGQLSERFREEISLRADRIYRTIAEADEELVWGDDYRIILRDMEDGQVRERSDDQLSGGQTMSAVVALRLALLQTIGARIAFFDEPTSNLDASRRENLAHAFRAIDVGREEVTEHWYDQLFLVSHDVAFTEITDQMIQLGE